MRRSAIRREGRGREKEERGREETERGEGRKCHSNSDAYHCSVSYFTSSCPSCLNASVVPRDSRGGTPFPPFLLLLSLPLMVPHQHPSFLTSCSFPTLPHHPLTSPSFTFILIASSSLFHILPHLLRHSRTHSLFVDTHPHSPSLTFSILTFSVSRLASFNISKSEYPFSLCFVYHAPFSNSATDEHLSLSSHSATNNHYF